MNLKRTLILDSSIAVKWLNKQDENYIEQSNQILQDVQNGQTSVVMPELAKYEVGNALVKKNMGIHEACGTIAFYYNIPIQFIPQDSAQAQDAMKIAIENKITFYDASFLALAKKLGADLVTDNPKHQNKYKGKEVKIIPLKNYK